MNKETPQKSMSEVLTSLINFNVERNPEHFEILDEFYSLLFYAEQMPKMSGKKYADSCNTFNQIKIRLISKISQL
jgi:hypothetical protein